MKMFPVPNHRALPRGVSISLLCFAFAARSWAGLTWEKDKVELKPEFGEKIARISFPFANTGATSVSVISVKPSCGCVATNLEKFEYAPGETGTIKITFDLEMDKDSPDQERTIKVTTNDAPGTPKVLELKVHVRQAVTVSPEALVWRHGVPGKTQEVIIKANSAVQAMQLVQTAQNDNFILEMKPVVEGESYSLKITPKNTDSPANATLAFDVQSPSLRRHVSCEVDLRVD